MAESHTIFSRDDINHFRINNLLYRIAPSAVRVKFDKELHPSVLEKTLKTDRWKIMEPLRKKKFINQTQWDLLYPKTGVVSSSTFDLTLMICLLRNLASIPVGDILPHASDTSEAADLSRIKYYRNRFAHNDGYSLSDADFELYWSDICKAILRLDGQTFQQDCNDLKLLNLTETNKEILIKLINLENAASTPNVLQNLNAERVQVWKEEERKVVKTRAFSRIEKLLQTNNIIVVVGSSGCGKSTAIHHAALHLHNLEDYEIVPVYTPGKIIRFCEPNSKQVFVIDDVCGQSTIVSELVDKWTRCSANIEKVVKDYNVKILLSCRTHIYRDRAFKKLTVLTKSSCDLESEYSLSKEERNQIASKYLTVNEVNALQLVGVMGRFSFFPLLCRMYSGFAEREFIKSYEFFSNPIKVIRDDLELLMNANDQTSFATLTLFIAYNNSIHEELLSKKSGIKQVLEDISDYFHMQAHFSIRIVQSELDKLMLSYVKNTEKTFSILHEKIYDIFLSFCGEHFVDLVIEVAHKDVIRDRFVLESIQTENQNQTRNKRIIKVPYTREKQYFERILKDVRNGFIKDIFLNRQFKCLTFRNKLFPYLQHELDIKKVLLDLSSAEISNLLLSMAGQCYWDMVPILLTEHVDINVRDKNECTPLYFASEKGNIDIAKVLLENQADPNISGWFAGVCQTPLTIAVNNGNVDLVKLLFAHHAYINTKNILHTALEQKNESIAKLLLDHKADCNMFYASGRTPLYETVRQKSYNLTFLLLNHGADPNISTCTGDKNTPLHIAFSQGNINIVKILLDYKGNLTIKNALGEIPVFLAVEKNYIDLVRLHLTYNFDLNICNNKNESLLSKASTLCHTDIVKLLLEHHCDSNICNAQNESPLYISSKSGHADIVTLLLEHKCNPNICNDNNVSPLFAAFENGDINIVRLLLEHSSDPNTCKNSSPVYTALSDDEADIVRLLSEHKCDPNICMVCSDTNYNILHEFRDIDMFRLLSQYKCDPYMCMVCNFLKKIFLLAASANGRIDIVKLLFERQNDPNICSVKNISSLFPVSENGHTDIIRFLIKLNNESAIFLDSTKEHTYNIKLFLERNCGLNICNTRKDSHLLIASMEGHTDIVKLLLEHKCDPHICNDRKESPLFIASMQGHADIVKLLLEHKCDPHICNDRKESPLFIASMQGHADIVTLLLEHKCDPNICNFRNESPVCIASKEGHVNIVILLLKHKSDPHICNLLHESPLFVASKEGHANIVTLLLEHECDPTICNFKDQSPLFIASKEGHADIVTLLLKHKCNPNIYNDNNVSPLFAAFENGDINIVRLLLEHSSDPNTCKNISPVYTVLSDEQADIVRLLSEHKCDPNICMICSDNSISPVFGDIDMFRLLLQHKCDPYMCMVCNFLKISVLLAASANGRIDIVKLLIERQNDLTSAI
ncbi:Hypothetical predicted protein [Mytilus galloprovincialis]|uniref:DZIP3-like HEPN domain-containing protein n=1 Tax=Mytilus galloprovincialis TaxID=29158 RepID=A0A8B6D8M6_MYTGA|nr:Hypothetical predicted protein [Mytilus galloprovincialis]